MAQTLKQIVDELREELSGYKLTDDTLLPDKEYFISKINEYRASVLREMDVIPESMYTTTCCNEIICVGQSCTIDGIVVKSKRKLFEVDLTNVIDGVGNKDIIYFGLDGFAENFTRVTLKEFIRAEYREFGANYPIYARIGTKAIIKNIPNESLFFICMTALNHYVEQTCSYNDKVAYPASESVLNRVKRLVKMDVGQSLGFPKDFLNDAAPAMGVPNNESTEGN